MPANTTLSLRLLGAISILAATCSGAADTVDWAVSGGFWCDPANWSPNGVPGADDDVYVGRMVDDVDCELDCDVTIASLAYSGDGMIDLNGHSMNVLGTMLLDHSGGFGTGLVYVKATGGGEALIADDVEARDGTILLEDAMMRVANVFDLQPGAHLRGHGLINFDGAGTVFINDERILPQNGELRLNAPNGTLDLDGLSETGEIILTQGNALEVTGDLPDADAFTGTIEIGPSCELSLGDDYSVDGFVEMHGDGPSHANLYGQTLEFDLGGELRVTDGLARVGADLRFRGGSQLIIENGNTLIDLWGTTRFDATAQLVVDGAYSSSADLSFDNGTYGGSGRMHNNASLEVSGLSTFNLSTTFDLDGTSEDGLVRVINAGWFVVNAPTLEYSGEHTGFDGRIELMEGSRMTINTDAGQWDLDGTLWAERDNIVYGDDIVLNGRLEGHSSFFSVNVENRGVVAPGGADATGRFLVSVGNYFQQPNGTLEIEIAGTDAESYDHIVVVDPFSGVANATLGGALTIRHIDGYVPETGDTFTLVSAPNLYGLFGSIDAPGYEIEYVDDTVVATYVGSCDGDGNNDGNVDVTDLLTVLNEWGCSSGDCVSDYNDDGVVDVSDLLVVLHGWGTCP